MEAESEKQELHPALTNGAQAVAPADRLSPSSLQPTNLDQLWRLSNVLSKSDLVPKEFRGQPANVLLAVQLGAEVGLKPMQALQNICVINGRPTMWGDAVLAVVQRSGLLEEIHEDVGDEAATCRVKRRGGEALSRTFTIDDAKKAGLWEKRGANGQPTPWVTYPKRMLQMRARGFALRDAFADVLKGLVGREEIEDVADPISEIVARIYRGDKERFARLPAWPHWARKELGFNDDQILSALERFERADLGEKKDNAWGYLTALAQADGETAATESEKVQPSANPTE